MKWLEQYREKRRWFWVGTAEARSRGGTFVATWNLFERADGKRKAVAVSKTDVNWDDMPRIRAAVIAWVKGGPLPPLVHSTAPPKKQAKLIAFPGGKDGAA